MQITEAVDLHWCLCLPACKALAEWPNSFSRQCIVPCFTWSYTVDGVGCRSFWLTVQVLPICLGAWQATGSSPTVYITLLPLTVCCWWCRSQKHPIYSHVTTQPAWGMFSHVFFESFNCYFLAQFHGCTWCINKKSWQDRQNKLSIQCFTWQ